MTVLIGLVIWMAVAFVVGCVLGRMIAYGNPDSYPRDGDDVGPVGRAHAGMAHVGRTGLFSLAAPLRDASASLPRPRAAWEHSLHYPDYPVSLRHFM